MISEFADGGSLFD